MRIEILKCLQDNYSYLIIDETNKNACVVDPGESIPIIKFVEHNNIKLQCKLACIYKKYNEKQKMEKWRDK